MFQSSKKKVNGHDTKSSISVGPFDNENMTMDNTSPICIDMSVDIHK